MFFVQCLWNRAKNILHVIREGMWIEIFVLEMTKRNFVFVPEVHLKSIKLYMELEEFIRNRKISEI